MDADAEPDALRRALVFIDEFKGDPRCSLNCFHAEALATEVHRLRAALVAALDALNCEPWHYVGMCDEEACFWCAAERFGRATDEAPHNADCPWATLSPHASAVSLRKYLSDE